MAAGAGPGGGRDGEGLLHARLRPGGVPGGEAAGPRREEPEGAAAEGPSRAPVGTGNRAPPPLSFRLPQRGASRSCLSGTSWAEALLKVGRRNVRGGLGGVRLRRN